MAASFDEGYRRPYDRLVREAPGDEVYPQAAFRTEWGPIFHRGRLDGSARVLVLGQDPATHETICRRILVGEAGQRLQGFLAKLGITRSYVLVNAFLYSVYGQGGGTKHVGDDGIVAYRNRWLDTLVRRNELDADRDPRSARRRRRTSAGATTPPCPAPTPSPTAMSSTRPTPSRRAPRGTITKAAAMARLTASWNDALTALHGVVRPDEAVALVPYGAAITKPTWRRSRRSTSPPGSHRGCARSTRGRRARVPTPRSKRATITVTVPRSSRTWPVLPAKKATPAKVAPRPRSTSSPCRHDAPPGPAHGDRLAKRRRRHGDEVGRLAGGDRRGCQAGRASRQLGHARPGVLGLEVGGEHHQRGRLERARPAERVERVLQVVGAGGDDDAGLAQRPHRGDARGASPAGARGPAGRGWWPAGRRRRCRRRPPLRRPPAGGQRLHAEADAVAGRDRVLEPGRRDERGELGQAVDVGVERLVGVQVEPDAVLGGELRYISVADRVSCSRCGQPPTRSAPDAIASRSSARWSAPSATGDRPAAQGHDLHVDDVGDPVADLDQRLDAAQAVVERDVDVGPHGAVALAGEQAGRPFGPLGRVLDVERRPRRRPSPRWRRADRRCG